MEVKKKKKFFTVSSPRLFPLRNEEAFEEGGLLDDKLRNDCIDQTHVKNRENNWRKGSGIIFSILRSPPLLFLTSMIFGTK